MSGTPCVVRPKDQQSMMWMEGVGWPGWEGGQRVKGRKRVTNVRNRLCRATVEHGLRQLAAARGEKSERRNAEGRMHLEPPFSANAWNMPGLYHVYVDLLHIHGIYMVLPVIPAFPPRRLVNPMLYHVYPWICHVYTWWIYRVYPSS